MIQQVKEFKTIEEQISILRNRGLIIDDEEKAKNTLSNLNYYRLSAYSLTLRKNNNFNSNVHFSDIIQIYNFDMELRAILMYRGINAYIYRILSRKSIWSFGIL